LNAKFAIRASNNLYIRLQTLLSDYDWRQYDAQWNERLTALPKRKNRNLRLSASLTHTLNASTFYKLDLTGIELRRSILGELAINAPANVSLLSPSAATAWPGATEPWNEHSVEKQLTANLSLVRQLTPSNQLKVGLETNFWDLSLNRVRYLLWPTAKDESRYVYSRYTDSFQQFPFTLAGYLNHKIEKNNLIVNLGLRYEMFSPNAKPTPIPSADSLSAINGNIDAGKIQFKRTLAPRLSIAIPVGNIEHLSFNYGWFYELPPLYYLYLNHSGEQGAEWPLLGNVDLKPLRSRAWEITYRRVLSAKSMYALTYFYRNYVDLLDASPYVVPGADAEKTVIRFENRARAYMSGLELTVKRDFGKGLNGAVFYTYLQSHGNAAWPESNLIRLAQGESLNDNEKTPLPWDQRHTINYNLNYLGRHGLLVNIFGKINSPAVYTDWLTGTRSKLSVRHDLDLKVAALMRWGGLRFEPFVEIHNALDGKYITPGDGGLDFSQPLSSLRNQFGRQIWVGITYR
jgi:outer membrane receptor protein involved in Fe transport